MKRWRVRFAPGEGPPWMQGREAIIFAGRLVPPPGRPLATAADEPWIATPRELRSLISEAVAA